jgi:hypothetical protein
MMQADQQLNLIERHFDGSTTEAEELVFQEKINADPAFREEAELHQVLLASLRQAGRNDLKQLLRQADETQEEPTTPLPATPASRWRLPLRADKCGLALVDVWAKNATCPARRPQAGIAGNTARRRNSAVCAVNSAAAP